MKRACATQPPDRRRSLTKAGFWRAGYCRALTKNELWKQQLERRFDRFPIDQAQKHLHTMFPLLSKIVVNSGQRRFKKPRLLIVLNQDNLYPLTLGLNVWNSVSSAAAGGKPLYNLIALGSLISVLPLLIAFVVLGKYWRGGLTAGATKG